MKNKNIQNQTKKIYRISINNNDRKSYVIKEKLDFIKIKEYKKIKNPSIHNLEIILNDFNNDNE